MLQFLLTQEFKEFKAIYHIPNTPEDTWNSWVLSVVDVYLTIAKYFSTGIYEASFIKPFVAKTFISNMNDDQLSEWRRKYGKSASESLREFALEYVGKPIDYMLRYGCSKTDLLNAWNTSLQNLIFMCELRFYDCYKWMCTALALKRSNFVIDNYSPKWR